MELPLCKMCGERHGLGFCPEVGPQIDHDRVQPKERQSFQAPVRERTGTREVAASAPTPSVASRVTMMQLRNSPGTIMDRVFDGETIDVVKNGKRVASIVPVRRS
jgi:prevent-host-death family protein